MVLCEEEALARLREQLHGNTRQPAKRVQRPDRRVRRRGKFLVLRNPHNRNSSWSAARQAGASAGRGSGGKPKPKRPARMSLHRLASLGAAGRTDWPEKQYKDDRASNVFLYRLEDCTTRACTFTNGTLLWTSR